MRRYINRLMPMLSERLHRPPEIEDGDSIALHENPPTTPIPHIHITNGGDTVEWSWPDAERRLSLAYEKDGVSGWAQAVLQEIEAERVAEKNKRENL